ncbi:MAG TPA: PHB depolymerase family esterase [Polyangiaceae bacterium]|nr:PHB depolymerase family esterase [Polyangiaceae bacterium]
MIVLGAAPANGAAWANDVPYGGGTTHMDLFVPDAPAAPKAPIVVAIHYCGGQSTAAQVWLQSRALEYGFLIITPHSNGVCFDATPTRLGERADIVAMVSYVVANASGDDKRVFAVGADSGACMTQALLAAYPEVFKAGSSLAGAPAGAWTGGTSFGVTVPSTRSAFDWGEIVRNANPGYSGARPRIQLWHGTGDSTIAYTPTYAAEVAQWTNVLGVGSGDATQSSLTPAGASHAWNRDAYDDGTGVVVEANSGPGLSHDLTGEKLWDDVVRFFGIDGSVAPGSGGTGGMSGTSGMSGMPAAGNGGTTGNGNGGTDSGSGGTNGGTTGNGGTSGGTGGQTGRGGTSSAGTDSADAGEGTTLGGSNGMPSTGGSSAGLSTGGAGANAPGSGGSVDDGATSGEDLTIERYHACFCAVPDGRADSSLWTGAGLVGLVTWFRRRRRAR